jgi:hypothetical protein
MSSPEGQVVGWMHVNPIVAPAPAISHRSRCRRGRFRARRPIFHHSLPGSLLHHPQCRRGGGRGAGDLPARAAPSRETGRDPRPSRLAGTHHLECRARPQAPRQNSARNRGHRRPGPHPAGKSSHRRKDTPSRRRNTPASWRSSIRCRGKSAKRCCSRPSRN